MSRIKILQQLRVYEIDGEEIKGLDYPIVGVNSHWNRKNMVVLVIGKKEYTVSGDNLITATKNAMNSGGY